MASAAAKKPDPALAHALRDLLLGVFFGFGAGGVVIMMTLVPAKGWVWGAVSGPLCGLIAGAWAHTFIVRRFWQLAVIIPMSFVIHPAAFIALDRVRFDGRSPLTWGSGQTPGTRLVIHAVMAIACIIIGYLFTIRFARRMETQSVRAQTELDIAGRVHERLVPEVRIQEPSYEVYGRSQASSEMGGDLIDAVGSPQRLDVFLADVSGHGVGAGIVMGMVKSAIRMRLREQAPLNSLVNDLNAILADLIESHMFATFACLRWQGGHNVEYALAGHLPILRLSASGELTKFPNENLPLGVDRAEEFRSGTVDVAPGDTFAIFTDGLTEVQNAKGRELGSDALTSVFAARGRGPLEDTYNHLLAAARDHGTQFDDQSLILVRFS